MTPEPSVAARRRTVCLVASGAVVALLVAVAFSFDLGAAVENDPDIGPVGRDTAVVVRMSLADGFEADGEVVYAGVRDITVVGEGGVLTALVEPGAILHRGHVAWRVADEPVAVLIGATPASRALSEGSVGVDVRQLEENLVMLGHDPDASVTVDDVYTAATAAMVERWQTEIGADVTGVVADGAVVFVPGVSRVSSLAVDVGDTVADGDVVVVVVSDPARVVEFTVPAGDRDSLHVDAAVAVRLPDGATVEATVTGLVERSDGGIDVRADPSAPIENEVEIFPVTVIWQVPIGSDVLTVPANALIRTDDGRYNVEVRRSSGIEELVPVEIGRVSGVAVEVIGDIVEGDSVIAP
jgi:peptidoglycan hydrolase-like protein with peptidoglycan-binding domain